ncbi:MAG: phosphotransferase enzyme family protein [Kineosporiaceae bacterium]
MSEEVDATGVLDPATALRLVAAGCAVAGRPAAGATPLRVGEDALVRLADGVLARVAPVGGGAAARHEVEVSRWFAAEGVPAVRPASGQVLVEVGDRLVTFWAPLPPHRPAGGELAAGALRRLHALALPRAPALPAFDPFRRVEPRLLGSPLGTPAQRAELGSRLVRLRAAWAELPAGAPPCVVHGDAWAGNVVETDTGEVLLLDLVRVGVGPPEWDLVATALDRSTFGVMDDAGYARFTAAYGLDVMAWPGFAVLRDIREIRVVGYALRAAAVDPALAGQAALRVRDLLAGIRPWPGWQPL